MSATPPSGVPRFERTSAGSCPTITCIGDGAIGGKASSLVLVHDTILGRMASSEVPGFDLDVPTMTVITTDVFDAFMKLNRLETVAFSHDSDDRIAHAFQRTEFPAAFVGDLRAMLAGRETPLAVRSSSLLEDDLHHPFAGVYGTKMIPNNQPDLETRFQKLVEAVKFVWASTFFRAAKAYAASVGQDIRREKMAVIIQAVVGERYGDRYYPTVSGVARSYNYYPIGRALPEQGVVNLALGLGKTIVDGGLSWTYSPAYPKKPPPFDSARDRLKNTQNRFWTVHLGRPPLPDPIRETEYMVHAKLQDAEYDDTLRFVASTYDGSSDRLLPGIGSPGPRTIDFAPILTFKDIRLNDLLKELLAHSAEVLGAPVEMEFAVNLDRKRGTPARFGYLQVRPMAVNEEQVQVTDDDLAAPDLLLSAEHVMGNGAPAGIVDVVYVKPSEFDAAATRDIGAEVQQINESLVEQGRPYLLIGFGRWGSSDPWLGIPVEYSQIRGARIIVEATLPQMRPDPSQGSHFFQNLIAFQVLYFSLQHDGRHRVDWDWLEQQETQRDGRYVKHVRLARSLVVRADGRSRRGVIRHDA